MFLLLLDPQAVLSARSNGDAQVMELKRRQQDLSEQKDLEAEEKQNIQQAVEDAEQQWTAVLQAAEDTQRLNKIKYFFFVLCLLWLLKGYY